MTSPTYLDAMFHRAQARLKNRKAAGDVKGQKAVAPLFQPAAGEADFYEIPAYLRKRIQERDTDNLNRAKAYAERVRVHIKERAA